MKLKELLARLRRTYTGSIGVEFMQMLDSERRRWLMRRMEQHARTARRSPWTSSAASSPSSPTPRASRASSTPSTWRPSASRSRAARALIPMLDAILEVGGGMGAATRSSSAWPTAAASTCSPTSWARSRTQIFSEFDGPTDPEQLPRPRRREVPHGLQLGPHHARRAEHPPLARVQPEPPRGRQPGGRGPRARQAGPAAATRSAPSVMPLLIHGDAAFIGQGVVAETLNLSRLPGYTTGGTIHVVINNQVGFTTDPEDSRSSHLLPRRIAQMLDVPVFHVNGDDPEAVRPRGAAGGRVPPDASRATSSSTCLLPPLRPQRGRRARFTQPQMYELIRQHADGAQALRAAARRARAASRPRSPRPSRQRCAQEFDAALTRARAESQFKEPSALEGLWKPYNGGPEADVARGRDGGGQGDPARRAGQARRGPRGLQPPPRGGAHGHHQAPGDGAVAECFDWGDGGGARLRHAARRGPSRPPHRPGQRARHLQPPPRRAQRREDGREATRRCASSPRARRRFEIYNSPLSETGVLGFEYGYSLDCPTRWSSGRRSSATSPTARRSSSTSSSSPARQVAAALAASRCCLPHGYEGQGPEHSSARLERFLELCAEDNIQVCNPTTPAQIFHLLRRQVLRPLRKPLVVMSPKSLLRRPEASSSLDELATGTLPAGHPRPTASTPRGVTRLLLCSARSTTTWCKARDERKDTDHRHRAPGAALPLPLRRAGGAGGEDAQARRALLGPGGAAQHRAPGPSCSPGCTMLITARSQNPVKLGYIGRAESRQPRDGLPPDPQPGAAAHRRGSHPPRNQEWPLN